MLWSWQFVSGTAVSVLILYFLLSLLRRAKKSDVKGKVVLITGASSGLGEGGKNLQKEGWKTSMRRQCDQYGVFVYLHCAWSVHTFLYKCQNIWYVKVSYRHTSQSFLYCVFSMCTCFLPLWMQSDFGGAKQRTTGRSQKVIASIKGKPLTSRLLVIKGL
jgi:hypothetical protein